jgi:hypothetical protein
MDVACFLSNQSAKMAPLVQIFFYFERCGKYADAGAQRFALCFTSQKNLKDAYTGARARPPARARTHTRWRADSNYKKI